MINVTIFTDSSKQYRGFSVLGHAGYADSGYDIICASVSVLTINTVNSIEKFTQDDITANVDENSGLLSMTFGDTVSSESKLLVDAMILGLEDIVESYGNTYIKISYKEV